MPIRDWFRGVLLGGLSGAIILASVATGWAQGTAKSKSVLNSEVSSDFPDQNTGAITPAIQRSALNDLIASWQQAPQVNAQVGTTYTFLPSDYGQFVTFNNAGSVAVTLPQATGSFAPWNTFAKNLGAGTVTITPQGGSTINGTSFFALAQGQSVWITSDSINYQTLASGGSGIVNSGTTNQLAWYAAGGTTVSGLSTCNSGAIITSSGGVPSCATTLPATVQGNITGLGTIGSGVWQGTLVSPTFGGTGINNGSNTLTLGASLSTSGAGAPTLAFPSSSFTYTYPTASGTLASLTIADQTLSGGANVTAFSIGTVSTGTTTIDCGKGPLQFLTNGGASTIAAPAADGSCTVMMINNASAGSISFSGFTVGANTGSGLTTTNTNKFSISIWRINGTSGYTIFAHQ